MCFQTYSITSAFHKHLEIGFVSLKSTSEKKDTEKSYMICQDHTAYKWQTWNLNPSLVISNLVIPSNTVSHIIFRLNLNSIIQKKREREREIQREGQVQEKPLK